MVVFPFYALVQVLVMPVFGAVTYFVALEVVAVVGAEGVPEPVELPSDRLDTTERPFGGPLGGRSAWPKSRVCS